MMQRTPILGALALLALVATPQVATAQKDETKFRQGIAKKLVKYGLKAKKKGYPRKAKLVLLMAIGEYDPDNEDANEALGRQRVGKVWQPIDGFIYPAVDTPNPSVAKALKNEFEKLSASIVKDHKRQAAGYEKAGRTDMAEFHYRMVLRFAADDEEAQKKLTLEEISDGLSGTALEQTLYERGKLIDSAAQRESEKEYAVEVLPDTDRHAVLDAAGVEYKSVKSEHFTIRGDYPIETLKNAAMQAERALRLMEAALKDYPRLGNKDASKWGVTNFAYFKLPDTYKQIVSAHRSMYKSQAQFEFIRDEVGGTRIKDLDLNSAASEERVWDGAVREVAQTYFGIGTPALVEGIGHTFVGIMLRNNRTFIVDRQEQKRTQASEDDVAKFSPDMDLWGELAVDKAWARTSVPAAELPLIQADKFGDEARIKSWSFCHYLVLRDPTLIVRMAQSASERNPIDVEKKFTKLAQVSLAQLEKEWRDFWTGATPVLRAIKGDKELLTAVSPGVKKWLDAINEVRTEDYLAAPVNWSASYSQRCRDHAQYLINNEISGAAEVHRQNPDLPGSTHAGNVFAHMAIIDLKPGTPKKALEAWMQYPGYRDLFVSPHVRTLGIYADKEAVVINSVQGMIRPRKLSWARLPKSRSRVPNQVSVEDLGPELKALLERNGKGDVEVVGYPISLHFGNSQRIPRNRDSIRCKVMVNKREEAPGILHIADGGLNRRTTAPGLVVFYPVPPIKKGAEVTVTWTFERDGSVENASSTFFH